MRPTILTGVLVSLAGLFCEHSSAAADVSATREAQMKAAYVFNFVKFVEWSQPPATIEICFVGADDVREALAVSTADKKVGAARISVRALDPRSLDAAACSVVYFGGSVGMHASLSASGLSALTIGDAGDFTREGGIIGLYMESNRLRFAINVENAKRSGLEVSSNLLKLASRIEQGATP